MREALDAGAVFNEGDGPIPEANGNIIPVKTGGVGGTRADYLARRIARDRPDMLPAMAAGEYKSIHDAAVQAGIAPGQKDALQEIRAVLAETAQCGRLGVAIRELFKLDIIQLESCASPVSAVWLCFLHRPVASGASESGASRLRQGSCRAGGPC